nr:hypothetical protein CFP56_16801 [Quercus suber]
MSLSVTGSVWRCRVMIRRDRKRGRTRCCRRAAACELSICPAMGDVIELVRRASRDPLSTSTNLFPGVTNRGGAAWAMRRFSARASVQAHQREEQTGNNKQRSCLSHSTSSPILGLPFTPGTAHLNIHLRDRINRATTRIPTSPPHPASTTLEEKKKQRNHDVLAQGAPQTSIDRSERGSGSAAVRGFSEPFSTHFRHRDFNTDLKPPPATQSRPSAQRRHRRSARAPPQRERGAARPRCALRGLLSHRAVAGESRAGQHRGGCCGRAVRRQRRGAQRGAGARPPRDESQGGRALRKRRDALLVADASAVERDPPAREHDARADLERGAARLAAAAGARVAAGPGVARGRGGPGGAADAAAGRGAQRPVERDGDPGARGRGAGGVQLDARGDADGAGGGGVRAGDDAAAAALPVRRAVDPGAGDAGARARAVQRSVRAADGALLEHRAALARDVRARAHARRLLLQPDVPRRAPARRHGRAATASGRSADLPSRQSPGDVPGVFRVCEFRVHRSVRRGHGQSVDAGRLASDDSAGQLYRDRGGVVRRGAEEVDFGGGALKVV